MPYTTSDSYDSYQQPGKRVKLEQSTIPFFPPALDSFDLAFSGNMQQNQLVQGLNVTPHINLQRASQSVSPVTVATTLSQQSTPSRSPSRVSIISDSTAPHDWVLFEESFNTLPNDQPKDRTSQQPISNTTTSTQPHISSYPLQMETALSHGYYAGFPTDFSKLSHQQYLNPFPNYQSISTHHHTHTSEDDPPALSPSHRYQSTGQQSVYESEIRSPMTPFGSPRSIDGDNMSTARTPITHIQTPAPKFTRTVTDAVEDELYTAKTQQQRQKANTTNGKVPNALTTLYQKAQNDHAMEARQTAPNQLNVPRGDSPFRANSPFHPMRTPQAAAAAPTRHTNFHPYMTFQGRREHQKELDAQSINDHMIAEAEHIVSTPKTISPKDAVLEYPVPEDDASKMSLFAHEQSYGNGNIHHHSNYNGHELSEGLMNASRRASEAESLNSVGAFSFHQSPQLPLLASNFPPYHSQSLESTPITAPVMIGDHHYAKSSSPITKPEGSKADTGAYTCTTPGCQQRFTTSQKLQKHRRENHRQTTPVGSAGMTSTLHGTTPHRHQGPHRCTRINPTTGKPCNTVFSRPYDLTRHEDTIHNTTREKVRCEICNDEKTFSRQDALTRHKKVKHGIEK